MSFGQTTEDREREARAKAKIWARLAPQHQQSSDPCAYAPVPCQCGSPVARSPIYDSRLINYAGRPIEAVRRND